MAIVQVVLSTCLHVQVTSGLVMHMYSMFEEDFELQIVSDLCIRKGKKSLWTSVTNAECMQCKNIKKTLLAGDTWLRQLCVIEGVGCGEFGINETMGCVFQRGEWGGLVRIVEEAGLRMM